MKREIMSNTCNWKQSVFFPNYYEVADNGMVKNKKTGRILKPATDKYGYFYYVLCVKGERKTVKAHRLVALTFIPNPLDKPTVNHKNGVRTDNRVKNLEWATYKEQSNDPLTYHNLYNASLKRDFKAMGALRDFGRIQVDVFKNGEYVGRYNSLKSASETLKVNYSRISECINNHRKSAGGYTFTKADSGNKNQI